MFHSCLRIIGEQEYLMDCGKIFDFFIPCLLFLIFESTRYTTLFYLDPFVLRTNIVKSALACGPQKTKEQEQKTMTHQDLAAHPKSK